MRDAVASTIHSLIYDVNNHASIMEEEPTSRGLAYNTEKRMILKPELLCVG